MKIIDKDFYFPSDVDCLLYRPIKKMEDHLALQRDLQQPETWASTWGMRFNAKKCYIMSINTKTTHFYQRDSHILQQVPENPYGCDTLRWHGETLTSTRSRKKSKHFLDSWGEIWNTVRPFAEKIAYLSLVKSTLEYSSIVWDPYL